MCTCCCLRVGAKRGRSEVMCRRRLFAKRIHVESVSLPPRSCWACLLCRVDRVVVPKTFIRDFR